MEIDDIFEKPYWIMDILPMQVPPHGGGQYFKVEQYYLKRMLPLSQKYANVLLRMNCYYDIAVSNDGNEWLHNPEPEALVTQIVDCMSEDSTESHLYILLPSETLMTLERDTTHMTIYNASDEQLDLLRQLATAEGLYVWKPSADEDT